MYVWDVCICYVMHLNVCVCVCVGVGVVCHSCLADDNNILVVALRRRR